MAKKQGTKPKTKIFYTYKVRFIKPFEGSLNSFVIEVSKKAVQEGTAEFELPTEIYEWIQKFGVTEDC